MLREQIIDSRIENDLDILESHGDREGDHSAGVESSHNIHYTTRKLFFSGLLRSGKKSGGNKFSSKETKKFLNLKIFHLWRHLKNNQIKNFISELRSPAFIGAIRSLHHSLDSGVVS